MPDNINYTRIIWQNGEEGKTPLNAENLNNMDSAIANLESELVEIQGSGKSALQMKQDETKGNGDFDFPNNPNSNISGKQTYGAIGPFATALGGNSQASGKRSLANGTATIAKGSASHAEGSDTYAEGGSSHSEGFATVAKGTASHAEGTSTQATAEAAHSEGAYTVASGLGSHAEGNHSQATGIHAHAEGNGTIASGPYTHTNGSKTRAGYQDQFIVGRFNKNKPETLFEVGCGNSEADRRNAFEVYQSGDIAIDGTHLYTSKDYLALQSTAVAGRGGSIRIETPLSSFGANAYLYPTISGPNGGLASLGTSEHPWTNLTLSGDLSNGTDSITIDQIVNNKSNATNLKNGREETNSVQGGTDSIADYDGDLVFGTGLRNTMENQAVFGKYNDNSNWEPNRPLLMVGNGESDSERKNAFEVYLDGHAEVQAAGTTDKSVVRRADLNICATTDSTGSTFQKDAIYTGKNITFKDGSQGTQNGDIIPGGVVSGHQSIAFGGLRYDYVNAQENNFDRTPTSVTGNQSMAVGGSVHVHGDWSFACCKDNETYQKLAFAAGGGNIVGQTEEEFNALWAFNEKDGKIVDSDNKTYENSSSLSAVFGETNRVTRRACFAAGSSNVVTRDYSAAFGKCNEITAPNGTTQLVCGYYNLNNANDIFEVGNGNESQRKNAFYVTKDDKAYIGGSVTKTDAANTLTTKNYVDSNFIDKSTHPMSSDNIPCIQSSGAQIWKNISETAYWSNGQLKSWSAMMRNSAGKSEVATATSQDSKYTITNKEYVDEKTNLNIEDGTGTKAIQMKQDQETNVTTGKFKFINKNPNAESIDNSLTGELDYGAIGNYSTVLGGKAQAKGKRSLAEGTTTIAKGDYSHAEGSNTVALGIASHAEGMQTVANNNGAHAEGNNTQALGTASHAEGYDTIASLEQSHAEGYKTQALNSSSHSEGVQTIASGLGSHAEGRQSQATGLHSHAEGDETVASGAYSHTNGSKTRAGYKDQFVIGRFNDNKTDTLFEVGNGSSDTDRKNAFEVCGDGSIRIGNTTLTEAQLKKLLELIK